MWPHERLENYFCSGANRIPEMLGLYKAGIDIGISVKDCSGPAREYLKSLAGGPSRVFVDSGAFSELGSKNKITDARWNQILDIYEDLGRVYGPRLYVVAPDCVGDQDETLRRLEKYRPRLDRLAALRVQIMVPIQKGHMPQIEMDLAVREIMGNLDYIRGIPCKRSATTAAELGEFCRELMWDSEVDECSARFHLLGIGPHSGKRFDAVRGAVPVWAKSVTCDAVRITALVGKTGGKGGGPRPLTIRRQQMQAQRPDMSVLEEYSSVIASYFMDELKALRAQSEALGWRDAA